MERQSLMSHHYSSVEEAEVEVVFDPPWNQSLMSEAAKLELGLV